MKAEIKIDAKIGLDEIKIGKSNLLEILNRIEQSSIQIIHNLSVEKNSETPDYSDIDAPCYSILNLIKEIRGF